MTVFKSHNVQVLKGIGLEYLVDELDYNTIRAIFFDGHFIGTPQSGNNEITLITEVK